MWQCTECESLLTPYHKECPFCGTPRKGNETVYKILSKHFIEYADYNKKEDDEQFSELLEGELDENCF